MKSSIRLSYGGVNVSHAEPPTIDCSWAAIDVQRLGSKGRRLNYGKRLMSSCQNRPDDRHLGFPRPVVEALPSFR